MPKFRISIKINQPSEIVTKALNNPDNAVYWTTDLEKFEVVKGKENEVGAVAHLHYKQKGRSYIMEEILEQCEPGRRYVSSISGAGFKGRVETILNPIANGTEMILNWSGTSTSLIPKIIMPFMRGKIVRQAKLELEKFKNLIEAHGAIFSKKN